MTTNDYKNDAAYKTFTDELTQELTMINERLEDDQEKKDEEKNQQKEYVTTKVQAAREGLQGKYHSYLAYLKNTFNVLEDDVLQHKIKEMVHKAKQKGYNLKATFLKEGEY